MTKTKRDEEIARRMIAGEKAKDLAVEFNRHTFAITRTGASPFQVMLGSFVCFPDRRPPWWLRQMIKHGSACTMQIRSPRSSARQRVLQHERRRSYQPSRLRGFGDRPRIQLCQGARRTLYQSPCSIWPNVLDASANALSCAARCWSAKALGPTDLSPPTTSASSSSVSSGDAGLVAILASLVIVLLICCASRCAGGALCNPGCR
jgi:hypothetical protein